MKANSRKRALLVIAALVVMQLSIARAQTASTPSISLSVRDIMAEQSIAGMRAERGKISPVGAMVAYLWSAAGRDPRDLYVVATSGGAPRLLVRAVDRPQENRPVRTETRDEARTGERREERVMQRDAFQQAREQSVSAMEWSPERGRRGSIASLNANRCAGSGRALARGRAAHHVSIGRQHFRHRR